MHSIKALALASALVLSTSALAADKVNAVDTQQVSANQATIEAILHCNALNAQKHFSTPDLNRGYLGCIGKALLLSPQYKEDVALIKELQDVLYAESNVLMALLQAKKPNARDIRNQSQIVRKITHKIEDLKLDLNIKLSEDKEFRSLFDSSLEQGLKVSQDVIVVDKATVEEIKDAPVKEAVGDVKPTHESSTSSTYVDIKEQGVK